MEETHSAVKIQTAEL